MKYWKRKSRAMASDCRSKFHAKNLLFHQLCKLQRKLFSFSGRSQLAFIVCQSGNLFLSEVITNRSFFGWKSAQRLTFEWLESESQNFQEKTIINLHTCPRKFRFPSALSDWRNDLLLAWSARVIPMIFPHLLTPILLSTSARKLASEMN